MWKSNKKKTGISPGCLLSDAPTKVVLDRFSVHLAFFSVLLKKLDLSFIEQKHFRLGCCQCFQQDIGQLIVAQFIIQLLADVSLSHFQFLLDVSGVSLPYKYRIPHSKGKVNTFFKLFQKI